MPLVARVVQQCYVKIPSTPGHAPERAITNVVTAILTSPSLPMQPFPICKVLHAHGLAIQDFLGMPTAAVWIVTVDDSTHRVPLRKPRVWRASIDLRGVWMYKSRVGAANWKV